MSTKFSYFFVNLDTVLSDLTLENFANIWQIKWNCKRSMKFETLRMHFISDVFGLFSSRNFATMATWRTDVSLLGRFRVTFTPEGNEKFVPRDQVSLSIVVYCLLLLHKNKWLIISFIHKNCSGQFLSFYFLCWEILNVNLTFHVCRKRTWLSLI